MVVLPWPFLPTSAMPLARLQAEIDVVQDQLGNFRGRRSETFLNSNPARMGRGAGKRIRFGEDLGLHGKKFEQIGQEQCLIGNAGKGGEDRLNIRAGARDSARQEHQCAQGEDADNGLVNREGVGSVVADAAEHCERQNHQQLASGQADGLLLKLCRKGCGSGRPGKSRGRRASIPWRFPCCRPRRGNIPFRGAQAFVGNSGSSP